MCEHKIEELDKFSVVCRKCNMVISWAKQKPFGKIMTLEDYNDKKGYDEWLKKEN